MGWGSILKDLEFERCGISVTVYSAGYIEFEKVWFVEIVLEGASQAMVTIEILKKKYKA